MNDSRIKIVLSLGSNLGDRVQNIKKACKKISSRVGAIEAFSSYYESPAWGFDSESSFINNVVLACTFLDPFTLLSVLQQIEREVGRKTKTGMSYSDRVIDIDILFYGNQMIDTPRLSIPHPLLAERNFVLYPLAEILPGWRHPVLDQTSLDLVRQSTDHSLVNRWMPGNS